MAERIKVREESSDQVLGPTGDVCNICLRQFAKYTCPRCNARYCSLSCYKSEKHIQCSESFYKENVMEALKEKKGSSEDKKKVVEMLRKMQESELDGQDGQEMGSVNGEEEMDMHERFAGMDLNSTDADEIWERLTESERREFEELLSKGKLADMLDTHTPWWQNIPKIQEQDPEGVVSSSCPRLLKNVPQLSSLLQGKSPSPSIKYDIINVLYAYCYVVRLYNGEPTEMCCQAAQNILEISGVLGGHIQGYSSCQEGLTHAMATIQQSQSLWNSFEFSKSILTDVVSLLVRSWIPLPLHALSDTHHLLDRGRKDANKTKESSSELSKKLWLAKKKCVFYLSWCTECVDSLRDLQPVVQLKIYNVQAEKEAHYRKDDFKPSIRPVLDT